MGQEYIIQKRREREGADRRGDSGIFQQGSSKKKSQTGFWRTARLPVDLGVGGRLTAGVGSCGQGGVQPRACPDVGRLGGHGRFGIERHDGSRGDLGESKSKHESQGQKQWGKRVLSTRMAAIWDVWMEELICHLLWIIREWSAAKLTRRAFVVLRMVFHPQEP